MRFVSWGVGTKGCGVVEWYLNVPRWLPVILAMCGDARLLAHPKKNLFYIQLKHWQILSLLCSRWVRVWLSTLPLHYTPAVYANPHWGRPCSSSIIQLHLSDVSYTTAPPQNHHQYAPEVPSLIRLNLLFDYDEQLPAIDTMECAQFLLGSSRWVAGQKHTQVRQGDRYSLRN